MPDVLFCKRNALQEQGLHEIWMLKVTKTQTTQRLGRPKDYLGYRICSFCSNYLSKYPMQLRKRLKGTERCKSQTISARLTSLLVWAKEAIPPSQNLKSWYILELRLKDLGNKIQVFTVPPCKKKRTFPSPWVDSRVLVTRCWTSSCGCRGGCGHGLKLLALMLGFLVVQPFNQSYEIFLPTSTRPLRRTCFRCAPFWLFWCSLRGRERGGRHTKSGPDECQASRESEKKIVWTICCRIKPCAK